MIFFKEYISIFQSLHKITHIPISYYKHERDKKKKKFGLWNNVTHHVKAILLLKDHILDEKIFIYVVSSTRH
jgi:hypothetical protein